MTGIHSIASILSGLLLTAGLAACGNDAVDSDEEARRAYLGLDLSIGKALNLGMDGFNAASSANIPDQMTEGDVTGMILIGGQVDQGESDNKGMRLRVTLDEYSDGPVIVDEDEEEDIDITYYTDPEAAFEELPYLQLSLRNIPDGTFTGTLTGEFQMEGDLIGVVTLNLTMAGQIESDGAGGIQRVLGTTTITGTATNDDGGTYDVDVEI
jgi:hypothetical protein